MGVKNVLQSCATEVGNTGTGDCFTDIGMPVGLIFTGTNQTFTTADITSLKTALEAAILANNPSERIFPLGGLVNLTDNTGTPVKQTFNDGSIAVVKNADYDLTVQWLQGGFCLLYALLKARGKNKPFLIYTDKNLLIGTDSGLDLMKGIPPVLVYPNDFKFSDGTKVTQYDLEIVFKSFYINSGIAFVDFSNDGGVGYLSGLTGLQDVNISQGAARALGVVKLKATTSCGTVDLHELYASELAVVGAWRVRNKATKNPLTPTAVADDPTHNGWAITVSVSDPNYTATAGGLEYALAGPTDLDAFDVTGYESNWFAQ